MGISIMGKNKKNGTFQVSGSDRRRRLMVSNRLQMLHPRGKSLAVMMWSVMLVFGFGLARSAHSEFPAIAVDPQSLSSTLPQGQSETRDLTIANIAGETLDWQVDQQERITVTHSNSMDVEAGSSVACPNEDDTATVESRYLRTFTLADFNIADEFDVSRVTFGIESLTTTASITVNLYRLDGTFSLFNLTLIGTANEELSEQFQTLVTVPVTGTVPAGSTLVVEIVAPDLSFQQGMFFPGMNALGETAPSYIVSEDCGIFSPTTMGDIGFPDSHLVMAVESPDCALPMWAGVTPLGGLLLSGGSQITNVSFDATGLSPGDFQTDLCISSNDTSQPLTVVPLVLRVTEVVAELMVAPQEIDFGDHPLDQPATPELVVIENTGPDDVILGALAFEGAASGDYSLAMDGCSNQSLMVGEFCGVEIGFTASASGVRTARLRIPSNASDNPHFIELTGSSGVLFADGFED